MEEGKPNYKFYVGSEEDCLAYNEEVKAVKNYQGTTTDWALPKKHPKQDLYRITKNAGVDTAVEGLTGVEELDNTWFEVRRNKQNG